MVESAGFKTISLVTRGIDVNSIKSLFEGQRLSITSDKYRFDTKIEKSVKLLVNLFLGLIHVGWYIEILAKT